MFRLLIVFATLAFVTPCASVNAQLFGRSWKSRGYHGSSQQAQRYQNRYRGTGGFGTGGFGTGGFGTGGLTFGGSSYGRYGGSGYGGYRSSYPSTLFGLSFGTMPYGYDYAGYPDPYFTYPYSYDPWSRGSFRAPDLLDDPYFYDRVPSANRYSANRYAAPQVVRPLAPATTYQLAPGTAYRTANEFEAYVDGDSILVQPPTSAGAVDSLQSASEQLLQSLAAYGGGDAWIEYLAADRINELAEQGNTSELRELMAKFDGVSQNHQLQVVAQISGFAETRYLLRQHLSQQAPVTAPRIIEPDFEPLPAPQPEPTLESPANNPSEI